MAVTYHERVLDNGLRVVGEIDPDAYSAAAGFFVRTGARDEARKVMGVSHFLEHMMFKGTEDITADEINRRFDDLGARHNAYTSHELTCFYAHTLPDMLPEAMDTLARMMRPALRQDDFDTEKGVILEEIAMYQDNPFWVLYERLGEAHYGSSGLGRRVLGDPDSITALERDEMLAYFEDRYSGDNTTVALAGKMDFDAVCDQVSAICGGWGSTCPTRAPSPALGLGSSFDSQDEKVSRSYMMAVAPGPGAQDERRYAASLLGQILGGSDNSRLHWALIEPGLADEAVAGYEPHDGGGEFMVYASGDPDRADEIWGVLEREMEALSGSLTRDDLDRLRAKVATGVTLAGEKPHDRMQRLGRLWATVGAYRSLDEELERIEAVTLDELRSVCDDFPLSARSSGRLGPVREQG